MKNETWLLLRMWPAIILIIIVLTFFSPGRTATAEFKVYVPEDYGTEYTFTINGSIAPHPDEGTNDYWYVETKGDTFLYVGPSFPHIHGYDELKEYRGEHIKFEASYFTLDDENWYQRSIHDIRINPKQELGHYPDGVHGADYDLEPRWWYKYIGWD